MDLLRQLLEEIDTTSENSSNIKSMKDNIDYCAKLLFGTHAGPVKDLKRSKEAKYFGVAHQKSILTDTRDRSVYLTFDNSTDSGEFEINSLVPLLIEKGSDDDKLILSLYRKYGVKSKKRVNYIAHGDKIVLREVHLGNDINSQVIHFTKALIKVLTHQPLDDKSDDEKSEDKPVKKSLKKDIPDEKSQDKPVKKSLKKEIVDEKPPKQVKESLTFKSFKS